MAADDDRGQTPDPWEEIVADGLDGGTGEVSFNFDEVADGAVPASAAGSEPVPESFDETPASATPSGDAAADDELVSQWLSDPGPDADSAADAVGGSSAIEIGTGTSGVALHGAPGQEEIGGFPEDGDDVAAGGVPLVSAGGTVTESRPSGAADRRPAKPTKPAKKSGGIGQMVGVVLGGLMAIPITLAILIYGLGKDPVGVTKQVPEQVAFLLPEKFRPGYRKPAAPKPGDDATGPSALDALPTVPDVAPEPETAAPADDIAGVDEPVMPDDPAPQPEPDLAADGPGLDDLGATPEPAGPLPLDTVPLDTAVAEAAALCMAIGAADDTGGGAYKTLRKRWYRSLARVADELVALEHVAVTSGRPMAATPDNVIALHGTIGDRDTLRTELASLAPFWLAATSRDTDGVVVPVTFESARKVGPYWSTRASIAGASGAPRDLTVISRTEPVAVAGDVVVVTGVAIDREGTVIWAADVRPAAAGDLSAGF